RLSFSGKFYGKSAQFLLGRIDLSRFAVRMIGCLSLTLATLRLPCSSECLMNSVAEFDAVENRVATPWELVSSECEKPATVVDFDAWNLVGARLPRAVAPLVCAPWYICAIASHNKEAVSGSRRSRLDVPFIHHVEHFFRLKWCGFRYEWFTVNPDAELAGFRVDGIIHVEAPIRLFAFERYAPSEAVVLIRVLPESVPGICERRP